MKKHVLAKKSEFLRRVLEMADFGQSAKGGPLQNSQYRLFFWLNFERLKK